MKFFYFAEFYGVDFWLVRFRLFFAEQDICTFSLVAFIRYYLSTEFLMDRTHSSNNCCTEKSQEQNDDILRRRRRELAAQRYAEMPRSEKEDLLRHRRERYAQKEKKEKETAAQNSFPSDSS
ncbi:hypothetical protein ACH5RR_014778 [Cinchona calisaya]|uniref:IBB domain-containing protein n=1 Tax=Cinchona calisaya TaxID=153742 RepID=A0ABD2ZS34_9GENT